MGTKTKKLIPILNSIMLVRTGLFVYCFFRLTVAWSQLTVSEALCENMINPKGVHPGSLFFSWEMESKNNNQIQTAYQLVIGSSLGNVKSGKFDVYNSGIVTTNQSIQVQYSGGALQPAQIYFWKVRVWDKNNKMSAWSSVQSFITGIFTNAGWQNAHWIAYEDMPDSMRVVPFIHGKMKDTDPKRVQNASSPFFRKTFGVSKKIDHALLFITGLGHYKASVNGKNVGDAFLAPGWTHYDKTVLYNSYDVTALLLQGNNTIGVLLGNGFYNVSQERYVKATGTFGKPGMIALIKITYVDGTVEYVTSNGSWKTDISPITFNNIYGGEDYDARLEQAGWNRNDFDDSKWKPAVVVHSPRGKLIPETDYPVTICDSFSISNAIKVDDRTIVYDFGQNVSGIPKIRLKGKKGQQVKIIPSELIHENGKVNQADGVAPHYYLYTLKGKGEEIWQPSFSYFAVRYVQVENVAANGDNDSLPVVTGLTLLHNRYASPVNGSFSCSEDLFNRIFRLIDWAIKSNLQSYITDNPQREKLSWQGEQNFMRVVINYNYNVYNLYRSLIRNMKDAQHKNGLMPDIAPEYVQFEGPFVDSPEWGTTAILDSWFLYKYYGDTSIIRRTYDMMVGYAGYLEKKSADHILEYGLGDWLDVGKVTPIGITATAYYYHAISALASMASVIGKTEDAVYYHKLGENIKWAFNKKYFNKNTRIYATGSQTAMGMPISLGMVEDIYKADVLDNLVKHIRNTDSNRLTAGDVGHKHLVKALFENNKADVLYEITKRDDSPGYGYMLKKGATALVETWDGKASQNQLAMGHILEWFYSGIAGITQAENSVAFNHILINPKPAGNISWAKGSFHSPYGWIKTSWELRSNAFSINIEIPVNTKATVILPAKANAKVRINGREAKDVKWKNNAISLEISSGMYAINVN